jgi:hypothetical protein
LLFLFVLAGAFAGALAGVFAGAFAGVFAGAFSIVFAGAFAIFEFAAPVDFLTLLRRRRRRLALLFVPLVLLEAFMLPPPILLLLLAIGAGLGFLAGAFLFWLANTDVAARAKTITEVRINLFISLLLSVFEIPLYLGETQRAI